MFALESSPRKKHNKDKSTVLTSCRYTDIDKIY